MCPYLTRNDYKILENPFNTPLHVIVDYSFSNMHN